MHAPEDGRNKSVWLSETDYCQHMQSKEGIVHGSADVFKSLGLEFTIRQSVYRI